MLVAVLVFTVVFLVCAGVAARSLVRMGRQLARAGVELERLGQRMDERFLPRVEAAMEQVTTMLRDFEVVGEVARSTNRSLSEVLATVGDITMMAGDSVRPMVAAAASVGVDRRRLKAVGAGGRAFFRRLLRPRDQSGRGPRLESPADSDA